jgi:hypothetical protein
MTGAAARPPARAGRGMTTARPHGVGVDRGGGRAEDDADDAAVQGQQDGLGQELDADLAGVAPSGRCSPIPERRDQARALTDPLDLAAVAEDALEGRTARGITTTATLGGALVPGDGVLLERLVANLLGKAERDNIAGGTVVISTTAHGVTSVLRVVNKDR